MTTQRLDQAMAERGLVGSRSRARDLIQRGLVRVDGLPAVKPAMPVGPDAGIELLGEAHRLVSRGGEKLAGALREFELAVEGRIALDIGASTGGFTQVLLEGGAVRVHAVDVGTGQLHPSLRADPRVVVMEGCDARGLNAAQFPQPIDLIVCDVSFISLTKALGPALGLAAPGADLIALVKPQFEAGPEHIGKGGIVRDEAVRARILEDVAAWIAAQPGWRVRATAPSPIAGGDGNREFLLHAVRGEP